MKASTISLVTIYSIIKVILNCLVQEIFMRAFRIYPVPTAFTSVSITIVKAKTAKGNIGRYLYFQMLWYHLLGRK